MKLPAITFYPGDWLRDDVSGCSLAAQGLWLRMMILAHDADRYGYLGKNGSPYSSSFIAKKCGCDTVDQYETLLSELDSVNVPSRTPEGVIYSRRMVRDAKERQLKRISWRQQKQEQRKSNAVISDVRKMSASMSAKCPPLSSSSVSSSLSISKEEEDQNHCPPAWGTPEALIALYNTEAADELPAVEQASAGRIKKAREYLKAFPKEQFWREVFQETKNSMFLRGLKPTPDHPNFKGDFDWLLSKHRASGAENCVRVWEKKYAD